MSGERYTWGGGWLLRLGFGTVALFIVGGGVWSVTTTISGAVVSSGQVRASALEQAIQSETEGVVVEILVQEGQQVAAQEPVVRLDASALESDLRGLDAQLFDILAAESRLVAEIAQIADLELPRMLAEAVDDNPFVQELVMRQRESLDVRREMLAMSLQSTTNKRQTVQQQLASARLELTAKREQKALLAEELKALDTLGTQGLVTQERIIAVRVEMGELSAEIASIQARQDEMRGALKDLTLTKQQLPMQARADAIDELDGLRPLRAQLLEKRERVLNEIDARTLTSPIAGHVLDVAVSGQLSFVAAGQTLMRVVSENDPVLIIARVSPSDIDHVYPGQLAKVRFDTIASRARVMANGVVVTMSPDALVDDATGTLYYRVEIKLSADNPDLGYTNLLVPGMPATAFLQTEPRTPLSYIMHPVLVHIGRAFRD